jgi:hypothetical protein
VRTDPAKSRTIDFLPIKQARFCHPGAISGSLALSGAKSVTRYVNEIELGVLI